ncbi:DUF523 domain-containing protein [Yersinia nurmii]|uniref:DUF523 domain-containing protein n=1 Tax=Yersinia nurmii TaxID=685706 RepID=A0AAW7K753_9GAMM|nr:DUF523 domain-containing protein [Yersinia nurmii]MDN0087414.1 DUF523 domain-containing protein [Yersinia nurmii]CNE60602.1 purine nucleoside phosphorylase [Yersinia nurmii]
MESVKNKQPPTNKVLVSACLMGQPVRYNVSAVSGERDILRRWESDGRLVIICPEMAAGMPVPRPAAEIQAGNGEFVLAGRALVREISGADVSAEFVLGAQLALKLARENGCKVAILTEGSPSCGSSVIYDGHFSGTLLSGSGVVTALLRSQGIQVFSQNQLDAADAYLCEIEQKWRN